MLETVGIWRAGAFGLVGVEVDGLEAVGVDRCEGLKDGGKGCADEEERSSGSSWGDDAGIGVVFFRRAGEIYACADCSSIACLLIRDLGSTVADCCHRGTGLSLPCDLVESAGG